MLIDGYYGKNYIDETQIQSMTIMGEFQWQNGNIENKAEEIYNIHINQNMIGTQVLCFKTAELAKDALLEIHSKIEELKSNKTKDSEDYVKGFKDGTEYALKLKSLDSSQ
jgi:hypothetical protein